jgi:hypothetical protein
VVPGPQFEVCVYDVLVTGDGSYAESAAQVTSVLVDPADHVFDDTGSLAEDFEGTVGSNFRAARYMEDPSTRRMAGPHFRHAWLPTHGTDCRTAPHGSIAG